VIHRSFERLKKYEKCCLCIKGKQGTFLFYCRMSMIARNETKMTRCQESDTGLLHLDTEDNGSKKFELCAEERSMAHLVWLEPTGSQTRRTSTITELGNHGSQTRSAVGK